MHTSTLRPRHCQRDVMHRRVLRKQRDAIRLRNRQAERGKQDGDERIALWRAIAAFNVGNVWSCDTGQLGYLLLRQLLHSRSR